MNEKENGVNVNREFKSDVFKLYFSQKKELIELYNALNGTNYTVEDELTINTLDNAIFLKIYNDVSFVLRNTISLYEHQSTVNPNMPLRDLFYIDDMYKSEIAGEDLYGYKQVEIPTPRFVVFYNGTKDAPERQIYRLSEAFKQKTDSPELELTVTVLNINYGHNESLMNECRSLRDYSIFIQRIRDNISSGLTIEDATVSAVDSCIDEHIMEEFLTREKAGVIRMHVLDFDEELHNRSLIEYGKEQGLAEGREEILVNMIKVGKLSDEEIASNAGCPIERVSELRTKLDSACE